MPRDQFALIPRNDKSGGFRGDYACRDCRASSPIRPDEECLPIVNPDDPSGETMLVPLTHGKFALIDAVDCDLISQHRWFAMKVKHLWYATASVKDADGSARMVLMHRLLLGEGSEHVDHRNGDGLDNRRSMIRQATASQNIANRAVKTGNDSGFKGVRRSSPNGGWTAYIKVRGVHIHLGTFATPHEAARVRDARALQEFGEFAWLNFPDRDQVA